MDDNPERRKRQKEIIDLRIAQAKEEISGVEFSEDQFSMLCEAFDRIGAGIKEAI